MTISRILLKIATVGFFSTLSAQAFACSYWVDNLAEKNVLMGAVATHLKVSLEHTQDLRVTEYKWWESISTPMCPEELTFEAKVTIDWTPPDTESEMLCKATVFVTRIDSWKGDPDRFEFKILAGPECKNVE